MIIEAEFKNISKQIKKLHSTEIKLIGQRKKFIKYSLLCTMIDGEVANIQTNQPSFRSCNIWNVKPSNINNLPLVKGLKPTKNYYKFGLSTLHC